MDHNDGRRTSPPLLTILLADDDRYVRSAVQMLVKQYPAMQVVGEAADIDGMLAMVWATRPQLILLDWELPGRMDAALIAWLHALEPQPFILVCSSWPEAEFQALNAGADAFVSKSRPAAELLQVLIQITDKACPRNNCRDTPSI